MATTGVGYFPDGLLQAVAEPVDLRLPRREVDGASGGRLASLAGLDGDCRRQVD
jgi:hypothetical protein